MQYQLQTSEKASIDIYDVNGRLINSYSLPNNTENRTMIKVDGDAGLYLVIFRTSLGRTATTKMIVTR